VGATVIRVNKNGTAQQAICETLAAELGAKRSAVTCPGHIWISGLQAATQQSGLWCWPRHRLSGPAGLLSQHREAQELQRSRRQLSAGATDRRCAHHRRPGQRR
jgi:hypothetical protein